MIVLVVAVVAAVGFASLQAPHVLGQTSDICFLNCAYLQYWANWAHVAGLPAMEISVSPSVSLHGFAADESFAFLTVLVLPSALLITFVADFFFVLLLPFTADALLELGLASLQTPHDLGQTFDTCFLNCAY